MTKKATQILSTILLALPSLMLLMSASMKLLGAEPIKANLEKAGLGNHIILLGLIELLTVILMWIPRTRNIGFFLVCSYLGGALSIELASGTPPSAALFLIIIWIAVFIRDKSFFVQVTKAE